MFISPILVWNILPLLRLSNSWLLFKSSGSASQGGPFYNKRRTIICCALSYDELFFWQLLYYQFFEKQSTRCGGPAWWKTWKQNSFCVLEQYGKHRGCNIWFKRRRINFPTNESLPVVVVALLGAKILSTYQWHSTILPTMNDCTNFIQGCLFICIVQSNRMCSLCCKMFSLIFWLF